MGSVPGVEGGEEMGGAGLELPLEISQMETAFERHLFILTPLSMEFLGKDAG